MTEEGRSRASQEELAHAREELVAAEHLLAAALPRIALTRIYFALFHAVRAVLYADGIEPRSHRSALSLFNLHFVKSGRFEPAVSRLLSRMQRFREEADYSEAFVIDETGVREELEAARALVTRLAAIVEG